MDVGIAASIVVERVGKRIWINAKGAFEIMPGDITKYWYMIIQKGNVVNATLYPYIVPGTTAPTTYEPYTGQTNTLTLPETIYGGSVDVASGVGQKEWDMLTLDGTEKWEISESAEKSYYARNMVENSYNLPGKCSHYKKILVGGGNSAVYIFGAPDNPDTADISSWKTYLAEQYAAGTPVQIAYKPIEVAQFKADTRELPALSGINTVLTDADSLTVTGREDLLHVLSGIQASE